MNQPQPNTRAPRAPLDLWTITATEFFHLIESFKEVASSLDLSLAFVGQLCTVEGHVFQLVVGDAKPAYPIRAHGTPPRSLAHANAGMLMADAAKKLRGVSASRILKQTDGTSRWWLILPNGVEVVAWVKPQTENEPETPAEPAQAGGEGTDSAPTPQTPPCGQPGEESAPSGIEAEAPPPAKHREPLFFVTVTGEARNEEEAGQLTYNGERIELCSGYLSGDWETARGVFLWRVMVETHSSRPQHVRLYFQSPDGKHVGVSEYRPMEMQPAEYISYAPDIDLNLMVPGINRFAYAVAMMLRQADSIPPDKHGTVVVHSGQSPNSVTNTFKVPPRRMPHAYTDKLTVASVRQYKDIDRLAHYTKEAGVYPFGAQKRKQAAAEPTAPVNTTGN